jgi:protein SCO1/2
LNKTALYAILLAAFLPLVCYFIVKGFSDSAIHMPRHYYADSVTTKTVRGKQVTDTVWHKLADFALVNQLGDSANWEKLRGKVIVADFFFTHCPTICPPMTRNMKWVQTSITNAQRVGDKTPDFLHFLSFSIDPERDSVKQIKKWADRFQINPEQWWLLTGDRKTIYDMAIDEMKLGTIDGQGIDTNFVHSDYFVLIDSNRQVRGYYHGLDKADLARLSNDIIFLNMEKDPKRKSFLAGKLEIIGVAFIAAIIGVGLLIFIIKKRNNNVSTSVETK